MIHPISQVPLGQAPRPIVLDLFSGASGLSLGFAQAGYRIGLGIEHDPVAAQTHRQNFGTTCYGGDIQTILDPLAFVTAHGIPQIDVIIGGPPCQGFTRVGRGKLRSLHPQDVTFQDPRNALYLEYIRFVTALQPVLFVMENVPDLTFYKDEQGSVLERIVRTLKLLF